MPKNEGADGRINEGEYPKVGGVQCGKRLRIFAEEARIPAFKESVKIAIWCLYSDLQKQMSAARRSAHQPTWAMFEAAVSSGVGSVIDLLRALARM